VQDELSPEIIEILESLQYLGEEDLWHLAQQGMSLEAGQELEALHAKQRDQGLSATEDAARARLIYEYERAMLIRAQAASLLKSRGQDVSVLLGAPASRRL
jgi:hypothetical protein